MFRCLLPAGLLLAVCDLSPAAPADIPAAQAALDAGMERLALAPAVAVELTEQRQVAGLNQPLETPGKLWLAPDGRFRWQLGEPPQTLLLIDGERFWQREGGTDREGSTANLGEASRLVAILSAVFRGQRNTLAEAWAITDATPEPGGGWTVQLRPEDRALRRGVNGLALRINGNGLPQAWTLSLRDGTVLSAVFARVDLNPALPAGLFTDPAVAGE